MITPSYALTATERVLPRLALDFTTASLDPRVTFTRALNTATCVDSSGYVTVVNANLPRFDYDPVTLVCKGLLIEESRKNIYLDSANLTTANWVNANNTLNATAGTSPANTNTANSVIPTNGTAAGSAQVYQTQSCSASTAYTYSIYLKASGMTTYQLRMIIRQGGGAYIGEAQVNVDLSAVSVTTATSGTPPTSVSATITNAGNSWYRVTVTGTTTSLTGLIRCGLYNLTTGNGTNGVLAWGAQVEAGAFATSYIPTDATAGGITRNADVATMTGTNFSDWYNASEGTMFAQFIPYAVSNVSGVFSINNGGSSNVADWRPNSGDFTVTSGGVNQADMYPGGVAANTVGKGILALKLNSMACCKNAGNVLTDNTALMPVGVNRLDIGRIDANPARNIAGWVQKMSYWPQRLTDAELKAFTK